MAAPQLALGSAADASAMARIYANTNLAAAAGVLAAIGLTQILYRKIDLTLVLNGALGGLVSITAEPLAPTFGQAALIGAVGGVLVVLSVPLLDKLRLDDVVGAIPVHLVCGIWGTMIVPATNEARQLLVTAYRRCVHRRVRVQRQLRDLVCLEAHARNTP